MSFYLGKRSIINLAHVKDIHLDFTPQGPQWFVAVTWIDGGTEIISGHDTKDQCEEEMKVIYERMK